jgi:hypothetical protein
MSICSGVSPFIQSLRSYMKIFDTLWIELIPDMVRDWDLVSIFYKWISNFPSTICWRYYLFSNVCFGLLCQKIKWLLLCGFVSAFSILFHWSSCLFLCWYSVIFYYQGSVVQFEFSYCDTPSVYILLWVVWLFHNPDLANEINVFIDFCLQ